MTIKNEDLNFRLEDCGHLVGREIVMKKGELFINGVSYEDNPEDPTYDLVREIRRLRIVERSYRNGA